MGLLAIYPRHDANVSVSDGKNINYFEIEKIAQKRYFGFDTDPKIFEKQFKDYVLGRIDPSSISHIAYNWMDENRLKVLYQMFPEVTRFTKLRHHESHAWSAYMFTDMHKNDLVISADGGGDEQDYYRIYTTKENKLEEIANIPLNLGKPYRVLGLLSPELYSDREKGYRLDLALSGKKMSLAALGNIRLDFIEPVKRFYTDFMKEYSLEDNSVELNFRNLLDRCGYFGKKFLDKEDSRDILATSQYVFENLMGEYLFPLIETQKYDRLIMVGGCGLNVTMNTKIVDKYGIEVFVPPCPNDCGISLGIVKQIFPNIPLFDSPMSSIFPEDKEILSSLPNLHVQNISLENVADLIASGKILGTVIGPLEIGPRALGNRSYLASPFIEGIKDRINSRKLKDREIWRPVAPIVTLEKMQKYFHSPYPSPYMTFAPKVREDYKGLLKELMHVDGSARIQTVTSQDGWIYDLLKLVGKKTGHEILLNTSFNFKGNPLINSYSDAFRILSESELDGVLVDEFKLFTKR